MHMLHVAWWGAACDAARFIVEMGLKGVLGVISEQFIVAYICLFIRIYTYTFLRLLD